MLTALYWGPLWEDNPQPRPTAQRKKARTLGGLFFMSLAALEKSGVGGG